MDPKAQGCVESWRQYMWGIVCHRDERICKVFADSWPVCARSTSKTNSMWFMHLILLPCKYNWIIRNYFFIPVCIGTIHPGNNSINHIRNISKNKPIGRGDHLKIIGGIVQDGQREQPTTFEDMDDYWKRCEVLLNKYPRRLYIYYTGIWSISGYI